MAELTPEMVRVDTRLGQLNARVVGEGRTTVLWSSMFVDSHTWDTIIPLLAADPVKRRFVLIDPPGLGLSDPLRRRSTVREAADAARDALHVLTPGEAVDWVGNAFGGHVGFDLARDPVLLRSLVAISSPAEPIGGGLRRQINLLRPLLRIAGLVGPVRDAIVAAMLTDKSAADPAIRSVVIDGIARPSRASLALTVRSFILDRTDATDQVADIRVPALFVASDDRGDWSPADAERTALLTPHAHAVTITGARTLVPLEQPATLAEAILSFWRQL